jgi:hypothetical protein
MFAYYLLQQPVLVSSLRLVLFFSLSALTLSIFILGDVFK